MRNIIIIIGIVLVLAVGGFVFWRGFTGFKQQQVEEQAAVVSGALVPASGASAGASVAPALPKKYFETIDIASRSFFFSPDTFRVQKGKKVTVNVQAFGDQTFTIDELNVNVKTPDGKVTTVSFTPQKIGMFKFYSAISGHREAGQVGTLIVE